MDAANFLAGRDLAVALLVQAQQMEWEGRGQCGIEACYRGDLPQDNFVAAYIDRLIAEPHLKEGFAAVFSDFLSIGCGTTDHEVYAGLTADEMLGSEAHHDA